jgi:hypothetical protein
MRNFVNVDEDNKEWLQSDVCELGFQNNRKTLSMLSQNKRENNRVGRMDVKKKEKLMSMSVKAWCYSVLTLYYTTRVREVLNIVTLQPPEKFILP